MPEKAQVYRYKLGLQQAFQLCGRIKSVQQTHVKLNKHKDGETAGKLPCCEHDPFHAHSTSSCGILLTMETNSLCFGPPGDVKVIRQHLCSPFCKRTNIHDVVCPPYRRVAGWNPYQASTVTACCPIEVLKPQWLTGEQKRANYREDHRLVTSCLSPTEVATHNVEVETKNKRLRIIATPLDLSGVPLDAPTKYFFNFKANGLVSGILPGILPASVCDSFNI